ncbi:hypothetical protein PGQ11_010646 [Apiospora arundinis]|uniref:Uncharacterized protein n=1 Tax=Apiospora arundinis TaxID=335852 RepID=A0ABR2IAS8_9PEZI
MTAKAHEFSRAGLLHLSTIPLEPLNESSRTHDPSAPQNDIESINDGPRQRLFPPEVAQAPEGHRKAHILHRTSYYGAAVLVFGTVTLLGVFGSLLFFWIQASRAGNNEATGALWKSIVDAEWTTRVVTISTTVIRVIVSVYSVPVPWKQRAVNNTLQGRRNGPYGSPMSTVIQVPAWSI